MRFSTVLGIAIFACVAIGLTMSLKDSVTIPDFRKEMSEVKAAVGEVWQEAKVEAQRKEALKPPEKLTLKMDNRKGEFRPGPVEYDKIVRNGDVLYCETERLMKIHDLQVGGTRYVARIIIDLGNYSGTWSVQYPNGELPDQDGRLIAIPARCKGYDLTFLDGIGRHHGDGTFDP